MYVETGDTVETAHTITDSDKRKPPLHSQITSLLHALNPLKVSRKPDDTSWRDRRRGSTQSNRSVHFDRSPAVHYTHSKEDYDRGGNATPPCDIDMATTRARWALTKRPPLLDDTDEDDCSLDLISEAASSPRRRGSIHNIA
ncbi:hypothetical protein INT43_006983 [Umbelopsis isabellina]|uniref:Uncharacterized protein n=1 Tax=Mortierella isabellina TaxID=91625 RepID=A0A8H7PXF1_MORIS|nr:hypothetical protein INT43_006983 [Umbelopsis isabellina]